MKHQTSSGLNRDSIAAMAMQGLLANSAESDINPERMKRQLGLSPESMLSHRDLHIKFVAQQARLYAEALIAELEKHSEFE